ncbi:MULTISPECIES: hypothetical protein [unclassified Coleofasciculus]|uniref:hypothetical protein n=1 Tax=Cyanophyceae TaxID=3028117 RepID=UPI001688A8E7|nr:MULTISPECIES: hypothetical protein [unclassified Coleofasciculus]MBD1840286.1 hypothetical protein [Coleofasciculus sp. FACHB-501]MBD1880676.1 hypothetical protein [Coleofasciculus sp. FACHB-T130]
MAIHLARSLDSRSHRFACTLNLHAKGTTFLSVGHHSTWTNYHQSLLESQAQTWQIKQPLALLKHGEKE